MTIFGGFAAGIKPGMIVPYAGNDVLDGFLLCDGAAISRTLYPELFAAIGTTYGAGDGKTTFNLPNFIDRTFWGGSSSGAYLDGTLPNITGVVGNLGQRGGAVFSGAFYDAGNHGDVDYSNVGGKQAGFDASRVSNRYVNGALVRPESVQIRLCIKF